MANTADLAAAPDIATLLDLADPATPWHQSPKWISFFFSLGWRAAVAHEDGKKTCAVVVPPIRSFAAAFCATGAVLGTAATADALPDVETHFARLASLSPGTPLVVKMGAKIYNAKFRGTHDGPEGPRLKVEYVHDKMTHYVPKLESLRVQVGTGGKRSLPNSAPRARHMGAKTAALEVLIDGAAAEFLSVPTVDAVLVGHVGVLGEELTRTFVRWHAKGRLPVPVTLASLLRPSSLLQAGAIPRSLLVSDRVNEFSMPVQDVPHVAVFDGSRAFARYRSRFPQSTWISVIDRCSAAFQEGIDVANQEFVTRKGLAPYFEDLEAPAGTEWQAFERR